MAGANPERLRTLLAPVVSAAGMDLEELSVTSAGRRRLVRLAVDRDGGVSLDDIADVSHHLSLILDSADAMGEQPYVLEVSSPGVDRPLTEFRHWRRARGRLVVATLRDGSEVSGRIVEVSDAGRDEVVLKVPEGTRAIALAEIATARVEVEFARDEATRPGEPAPTDETAPLEPAEQPERRDELDEEA
jgi:ribosome maturation factor RimP